MSYHWSTHQLTEYLAGVSAPDDPAAAIITALERATETLDAELGAVIISSEVQGSVGFGRLAVPATFSSPATIDSILRIVGIGEVHVVRVDLDTSDGQSQATDGRLVIGRIGEHYTAEEHQMLQGMALVLGLVLRNLETLRVERSRHHLVETLLAIQRAISARRPLTELLDAITAGASSLVGGSSIALLLADPLTPGVLLPASSFHFPDLDQATLAFAQKIMTADVAATGQLSSDRDDTGVKQNTVEQNTVEQNTVEQNTLAEPVVVDGEIAGCLIARIDELNRHRIDHGDLLTAFAQQVSLALTDARTLEAVHEAHHDSVTGLPNRTLFLKRLDLARRAALGHGHSVTVLFIDLDQFKAVNDTFGHLAGDHLLAEVGHRIAACVRPQDTAARLGGDEFSVLLDGVGVDAGQAVAARIIGSVAEPFSIAGREVFIGASVGIAPMTVAQSDANALLSDADVAMYCAKRSGRGRSVVFETQMHDEVVKRLNLRTDLQRALENGELGLAYQPIIRLDSLQIDGVEAMMRWNHPSLGSVPPSDFIPIAEESDTIMAIRDWAALEGLTQVQSWRSTSPELRLGLHVSARQVADPELIRRISSALELTGMPAESLTLEIAESLIMDDEKLAIARLGALKDLGIQLAIDDFGTGYSSLSCLRKFPVDLVKIDCSFISALKPGSSDDIAVVRGVVELCQSLRLKTLAEGVEGPEQVEILTDLGCDLGQGSYFSPALKPEQWNDYVNNRRRQ